MFLKKVLATFVLAALPQICTAQFGFEYDPSIPVLRNGDTLLNPWAGGLNYAQFSDFDFDFDGDADLFLFDRSSSNVRVFTQEGTVEKYYKYVHDAADYFPPGLSYRAALVDYDNDGRKDLFTAELTGIRVYRNVGDQINGLQWELAANMLYSEYVTGNSILGVSLGDIPAITDVDFDGDIDILTFNSLGNRVEYHQNQSMELYGVPDSLIFELRNECWGKFTENDQNNGIVLNDPNAPCVGGNIPNPERETDLSSAASKKHVGSSILAIDIDSSGVLDLLIGDASYSSLTLLINGGTAVNTDSPMTSLEYNFPMYTTPIKVTLFPASYFLDVDFDGVKDLITTPNALLISFNESSVKFYKNTGTNGNPYFVPQSSNFLQDGMIEHGTGSVPVLADIDEDGLNDLLVANYFRFKPISDKESTLAYYRNVGTASSPVFEYVDYDYLNLSAENYGLRSTPAFADLDDDGDEDMLLAIENGTLVYYENESIGSGAVWGTPVANYQDHAGNVISNGNYSTPALFDLNGDNLTDLIIGTKTGNLVYYENVGTAAVPLFELKNSNLGNVNVAGQFSDGYAIPHFIRENGNVHLFVGSYQGTLWYYNDIENNLGTGDAFHLVSPDYLDINVGRYSSFWVEDINADGNLNMFVGQDLGGVYHFEADPNSDVSLNEIPVQSTIAVYPNPAETNLTIAASTEIKSCKILDMQGRVVQTFSGENQNEILINIADLKQGIYAVSVELSNGSIAIRKVLKQ